MAWLLLLPYQLTFPHIYYYLYFVCYMRITGWYRAYDMVYCFNADGTMYMESQNMRIDAVYTLEDGQIITTYMLSGQEGTMEEAYYFDGDTLVISGIGYQKE